MCAAVERAGPIIGIRHLQAVLLFLAIFVRRIVLINVNSDFVNALSSDSDLPASDWTYAKKRRSLIDSFYWASIITNFLAGFLIRRFGVKVVLFTSISSAAVLSALTDCCINWGGWVTLSFLHVVLGLSQGLILPCILEHLAKWSPPKDRNRLGVFAFSGAECGSLMNILGLPGRPGIYYVSAGMCGLWCVLWLLLGANNAPSSRLIGQDERDYIERSMKRPDGFHGQKIPVPWRAILTSVPFYALLMVRCGQGVATYSILNTAYFYREFDGPTTLYFELAMLCMAYIYLVFADVTMSRKWISMTILRKFINTLAFWGPAAGLVAISILDKVRMEVIIVFMALNAGLDIGGILSIIDISPNHSGMIMGITNAACSFFSLSTMLLVNNVFDEWFFSRLKIVFCRTAVVLFISNLAYIIWGSSEQQPWDAADFMKQRDVELSQDITRKTSDVETRSEYKYEQLSGKDDQGTSI